jgi:hypothetical protein
MITRAQAEALLTLAESLEACERLGVQIHVPGRNELTLVLTDRPANLEIEHGHLTSESLYAFLSTPTVKGVF